MNKWQRHMHNSVVLRQLSGSGWTAAREKDTSASASSSLPHPLPWHLFQRRAWCRPGTAANRWTRRHGDQLMNKWMQHTAIICIFKEKKWHISALSAEKYRGVLLLIIFFECVVSLLFNKIYFINNGMSLAMLNVVKLITMSSLTIFSLN